MKKQNTLILTIVCFLLMNLQSFSQDRNFYIYLCFGQSNMQGAGQIQNQDKTVDSRFKVFQVLDCSNLNREKATWYTAVPPLCNCYSGLSPADYFGRTMVANLPDSITVGIINVSIAGCDIRLFDKDIYMDYDSTYVDNWFTSLVAAYDWNPYQYLIDQAKLAQKDGVIKGILLHQGETNSGQEQWLSYVKKIYNDMMADLSLDTDSVPILAGEVLSVAGNCCSGMNSIINRLPDSIPTAHIISSDACTGQDAAHFDSPGYRKFGKRYAVEMLSFIGYEAEYAEAECGTVDAGINILADVNASNSAYVMSVETVPASYDSNIVKMDILLSADTTWYLYGRFKTTNTSHKSFWFKIDNGEYELFNGLTTNGWEWIEINNTKLTAGDHSISIAFSEDSVMLDKIVVKNAQIKPVGIGEEANKICKANITTGLNDINPVGYGLEQSYPNPASNSNVTFTFKIPNTGFVSLTIFNSQGELIDKPAGGAYNAGEHVIEYNTGNLKPGIYFYTMQADKFNATRKLNVLAR
ncbi:MAG: T9SS type A sorting domain-containing protein [Salinivirgaceae bacterium]|nr:T9SS type A sorting domain-containing protein [Salinivirgaceae bacterium]